MMTEAPADDCIEAYTVYRPAFQRHFQVYYAPAGSSFDSYDLAYQYGYELGVDPETRMRYWDEIKEAVEADWAARQDIPWSDINEAVYYAWVQIKHFADCGDDEVEFAFYEPSFHRHFEDFFAPRDLKYDDYEAVYRTGYSIAMNPRYHFYDWFEIEPDAKKALETDSDLAWDDDVALTLRASVEAVKRNSRLLHYSEFETTFRRHYYTHYSRPGGKRFVWYEPAYRYGFDLAMDKRYRKSNWFAIESELKTRWDARGYSDWDAVSEAAHRAWVEVKDTLGVPEKVDPTFSSLRRRYDERFAEMGYPSDNLYEAGFRFGYYLAADGRYRYSEWREVLSQVEQHWQANPALGSLASFRLAAQDGWNQVKNILKEMA